MLKKLITYLLIFILNAGLFNSPAVAFYPKTSAITTGWNFNVTRVRDFRGTACGIKQRYITDW
jgi:hypothetical protein